MGRIIKEIEVEGQSALALFDTGATNTYVDKCLVRGVPIRPVPKPYRVALGGKTIEVKEVCTMFGKIEGLDFDTESIPVDEIGKIDGQEVTVLIGALTMEKWEIRLSPKDGTLDLTGLRRRGFTEYWETKSDEGN